MDLNQAIVYGQLVSSAYAVPTSDLTNHAGTLVSAGIGPAKTDYSIVTSIYANDLATDMQKQRADICVSIGFIAQSAAGDVVIAIRGTEGIYEWVHDAMFLTVPCPFLSGGGHTEDGFTSMYQSMTIAMAPGSTSVIKALPTLPFKKPIRSLTICGHSLGGALATLLALDVAANSPSPAASPDTSAFKTPTVYTYASPRAGDAAFATTYNHVVPNTFRIANRIDLVPKLPLPPLYEHANTLFDLNPIKFAIPPQILVKCDIACEHYLTSYLHLISLLAGGAPLPLDTACVPGAAITLPAIH
jgi:hypothetical protein